MVSRMRECLSPPAYHPVFIENSVVDYRATVRGENQMNPPVMRLKRGPGSRTGRGHPSPIWSGSPLFSSSDEARDNDLRQIVRTCYPQKVVCAFIASVRRPQEWGGLHASEV